MNFNSFVNYEDGYFVNSFGCGPGLDDIIGRTSFSITGLQFNLDEISSELKDQDKLIRQLCFKFKY